MKHLKTKNLFESTLTNSHMAKGSNDIDDLKDICLELEDEGFDVIIGLINGTPEIRIKKHGAECSSNQPEADRAAFNYNQVSEVVHRLEDYLGDFLYKVDILYLNKNTQLSWGNSYRNFGAFKGRGMCSTVEDFTNKNIQAVSIEYKGPKILEMNVYDSNEDPIDLMDTTVFNNYSPQQISKVMDLQDLCLEMEDSGLSVKIYLKSYKHYQSGNDHVQGVIRIQINGEEATPFDISDISEDIKRISDYLSDSLIGIRIFKYEDFDLLNGSYKRADWDDFGDYIGMIIDDVKIRFRL